MSRGRSAVLREDEPGSLRRLRDEPEERRDAGRGAVDGVCLERRHGENREQAPEDVYGLDHVADRGTGLRRRGGRPLVRERLIDGAADKRSVGVVDPEKLVQLEERVVERRGRGLRPQHLVRHARPGGYETHLDGALVGSLPSLVVPFRLGRPARRRRRESPRAAPAGAYKRCAGAGTTGAGTGGRRRPRHRTRDPGGP